ncbi:MAG: dicarboxylate/amino acid:cation symporter [Bacteroidales bacterium]|nr:dicarboxylate/amino acid:cation symporter [Bacteroidales bacterium]
MKKTKFALHWQILIALIIAVLYGISFPNKYHIKLSAYEKISKEKDKFLFSDETLINIENLIGSAATDKTELIQNIEINNSIKLTDTQKQIILKYAKYNPSIKYISWMGIIFLKALKMIIIPLILMSIISGIANIGSAGNLGRLGLKTFLYYLMTSTAAIIVGLIFVNAIKPGIGIDKSYGSNIEIPEQTSHSLSDTLLNIIPENIFEAFVNNQMLSIIFFAILFGFFVTRINTKSRIFLTDFFNAGFEVMMKITMFIILFTPFGVFGLVAEAVADQSGQLMKFFSILGMYTITVLAALLFHALIILPILLKFIAKVSPWAHFKAMRAALLTAFSTSSSGATLSLTMESVEHKSGVSRKISGFTLPLGATINMDGTALYEAVAALFIAQAYGFDLGLTEQIIIVVTGLLVSIGAAGIPMAGLFMITIILTAVDLPLAGVALILPVDRILDMFRTSVNVWSDSCGAVIVAKSEGEKLKV